MQWTQKNYILDNNEMYKINKRKQTKREAYECNKKTKT